MEDDSKQCESLTSKKIFVGGYDPLTPKEALKEYFQQFGPVQKIIIKITNSTIDKNDIEKSRGLPHKGYCFVKFKNSSSVQQVLSFKEHKLNNRIVDCRPVRKGNQLKLYQKQIDQRRLFVSNILANTTDNEFIRFISQFSSPENFYFAKQKQNNLKKSTKIGFLTFPEKEDIEHLLSREIFFKNKKLNFQRYLRKDKLNSISSPSDHFSSNSNNKNSQARKKKALNSKIKKGKKEKALKRKKRIGLRKELALHSTSPLKSKYFEVRNNFSVYNKQFKRTIFAEENFELNIRKLKHHIEGKTEKNRYYDGHSA